MSLAHPRGNLHHRPAQLFDMQVEVKAINHKGETSGNGYTMWRTRRRNTFQRALQTVLIHAEAQDLPLLLIDFAIVCEYLAPWMREPGTALPRGYTYVLNALQEPSVAKDGILLNPSVCEPVPTLDVARQFAWDLRKGWLDELAAHLGLTGSFSLLERAS